MRPHDRPDMSAVCLQPPRTPREPWVPESAWLLGGGASPWTDPTLLPQLSPFRCCLSTQWRVGLNPVTPSLLMSSLPSREKCKSARAASAMGHRLGPLRKYIYFLTVLELEVQDQDVGKIGSLEGLSPWLVCGRLLPMSSSVRVSENCLLL